MFEVGADPNAAGEDPDDRAPPARTVGPGGHFGMSSSGTATANNEWVRAREDATAYFVAKDDLQRLAMVSALIERGPDRNPPTAKARSASGEQRANDARTERPA
jgi:hypothetical protein